MTTNAKYPIKDKQIEVKGATNNVIFNDGDTLNANDGFSVFTSPFTYAFLREQNAVATPRLILRGQTTPTAGAGVVESFQSANSAGTFLDAGGFNAGLEDITLNAENGVVDVQIFKRDLALAQHQEVIGFNAKILALAPSDANVYDWDLGSLAVSGQRWQTAYLKNVDVKPDAVLGLNSGDANEIVKLNSNSGTSDNNLIIEQVRNATVIAPGDNESADFVIKRKIDNQLQGYIKFNGSTTPGNVGVIIGTETGDKVGIIRDGSMIVGGTVPQASATLEVYSTTKGFLPPRMTTAEKNAIVGPVAGLMVYDTTLNKLCVYTGAAFETITSV